MYFSRRGTTCRRWARALALPLAIPLAALLLVSPARAAEVVYSVPGTSAPSTTFKVGSPPMYPAGSISPPVSTLTVAAGDTITFRYNNTGATPTSAITIYSGGGAPGSTGNPGNPYIYPNGSTSTSSYTNPFGSPASDAAYQGASPAAHYGQLLFSIGTPTSSTIQAVPFSNSLSATPTATFVAATSGTLYLFVNDNQYGDNSGAFSIGVTDTPTGTGTGTGTGGGGAATPEAPAGLLLAVGMLPLAGLIAWRRKRAQQPHDEL